MKLTNIVFCLTLLAGAATSCIREDLDDCLSTNTLLLSYKGDGTTEIFPDKICRVEMFVFDAENRCVNSSILPEEQVKDRTATLPPLAAGDYRIVCLGNTHHTKVDGIATGDFGRMLFAAGDYFDEKQVAGNDSLYYATTSYTVLPYSGDEEANQTKTIEFASSHYDLSVEVAGVPAPGTRAGSLPVLEICGVSPCTDFENRACGEATDYLLETEYEAGKALLTARTNIMRHKNHENVKIGKAGRKRNMGWRPTVRGSVMNPNDHPHGGGEGKSPVGRPGPVTPWGKPALGYKTRSKKKASNKFIVKRRNGK